MTNIRVLIVDDHAMVRRGLHSLLSMAADIEVVGECGDGASALETALALHPDIVLMDIKMPGQDGVSIANHMRHMDPAPRVIHLTAYEDDEYLQSAFRAGAYAYLLKSASDETVIDTVRRVRSGERLLSPTLLDKLLRQFQHLAEEASLHGVGLDDQDLRVLRLAAQGGSNEEIAQALAWSERSVRRKIEEISQKLGARNRTQAVAQAIKLGLI